MPNEGPAGPPEGAPSLRGGARRVPAADVRVGADEPALLHLVDRPIRGAGLADPYASDPLSQRPLVWLMDKAAGLGLVFRDRVVIDTAQVAPPINDSYREFAHGYYRFFSRRFYRPVGSPPDGGTRATTARINETIDGVRALACGRSLRAGLPLDAVRVPVPQPAADEVLIIGFGA